jgi:hypothetical protein
MGFGLLPPAGEPRLGPFFRPILDSISGVRETNGCPKMR